jgi:hypothetical protein
MPEFPLLKVKVDKWDGTEVVLVVVTEYFTILFYEYFLKYKIRSSNQETMYFFKSTKKTIALSLLDEPGGTFCTF